MFSFIVGFMLHTKLRHKGAVKLECRIEKTQSYTFALSLQTSSLKIVKLENFEPTKFSRKSVKIKTDIDRVPYFSHLATILC